MIRMNHTINLYLHPVMNSVTGSTFPAKQIYGCGGCVMLIMSVQNSHSQHHSVLTCRIDIRIVKLRAPYEALHVQDAVATVSHHR